MTLFLWHLTALVLGVLVLHPLGLTQPPPGTPTWWAVRPLWLLVPAAMLAPLVALFARFERPRPALWTATGGLWTAAGGLWTAAGGLWTAAGIPTRRAVRSPSGGPSAGPGRCRPSAAGTAAGVAAVIVGLLGVAVGGIWPLPGSPGNLVGLQLTPAASLLSLGAGMLLLGAVGSGGE